MAAKASTTHLKEQMQTTGTANNSQPATQSQSREVTFKSLHNLFDRSAAELKKVLPKEITPERIARVTLTAARKNPALLDASPQSLIAAVFQAAQLGLEPDLNGSCYLVPFKEQVQLIIGYKGYIDLIYRSQRVITVQALEVRENDFFKEKNGSEKELLHEKATGDRGKIIGYYAICHLINGGCIWHYMTKTEIEEYRDQHSKDYVNKKRYGKESQSIWHKHFDSMAKKTVLRQLTTWLPLEVHNKAFTAVDETVRKDIEADPEYIDMETEQLEEAAAQ